MRSILKTQFGKVAVAHNRDTQVCIQQSCKLGSCFDKMMNGSPLVQLRTQTSVLRCMLLRNLRIFILFTILQVTWGRECVDFASAEKCNKMKAASLCWTIEAQSNCRRTCDFCAGWTSWSEWGDCSATSCNVLGDRVRTRRCRGILSHSDCRGSMLNAGKCSVLECLHDVKCSSESPSCGSETNDKNCEGMADECDTSANQVDDGFFLSSRDPPLCLMNPGDELDIILSECPSRRHHSAPFFLWRWISSRRLQNIGSEKCLSSVSNSSGEGPTIQKITAQNCEPVETQFWTCENQSLGIDAEFEGKKFLAVDPLRVVPVFSKQLYFWDTDWYGSTPCATRTRWSDWGEWSLCLPTCTAVGKGKRMRNRTCLNDDSIHGSCAGNFMQYETCNHERCQPQCPEGFSLIAFPWACYKFESVMKASLNEAEEKCGTMQLQNVTVSALLAADKSNETRQIFNSMMKEHAVSELYLGVNVEVIGMAITGFEFHIDGRLLHSKRKKNFIEILVSEFEEGTLKMFKLNVGGQGCLDLANDSMLVVLPCSNGTKLWASINDFLIHVATEKCLSWMGNDSTFELGSNETEKIYGKRCSLGDDTLKWIFRDEYLLPAGRHHHECLGVTNGSVKLYDANITEWIGYTLYSGPRSLNEIRDNDGSYFFFKLGTHCLAVDLNYNVTLKPCHAKESTQKWNFLWKKHLLHRVSGKCLSLTTSSPTNGTIVVMKKCSQDDRAQEWRIKDCDSDTRCLYADVSSYLQLWRCGVSENGDKKLCVRNSVTQGRGWRFQKVVGQPEKMIIYQLPLSEKSFCLRPLDPFCNASLVTAMPCEESETIWWKWDQEGHMLLHVSSDASNKNCCLSTTSFDSYEVAVLDPCDGYNESQFWTLAGSGKGLQLAHVLDGDANLLKVFQLAYVHTDNSTITRLLSNATDESCVVTVIQSSDDQGSYGSMSFAESTEFEIEDNQDAHQNVINEISCEEDENKQVFLPHRFSYCRSPLSCRLNDKSQNCSISLHNEKLGVKIFADDDRWIVTEGTGRLPYVCEAPVECVYGIGQDYSGTVAYSDSGKPCLNWRKFQQITSTGSPEVVIPNHSFCRNPNDDPRGVWCWVKGGVKEYCSFIQICVDRCLPPPTPLGGKVVNIEYTHPGINYGNGSTITFGCGTGRSRNRDLDASNNYDIICLNGVWVGILPTCNIIDCIVPAPGIRNAELKGWDGNEVISFEKSIVYRCLHGYLLPDRSLNITFSCIGKSVWKSDWPGSDSEYFDKNRITNGDVANISCVRACDDQFDKISGWCIKMLKSIDGIAFIDSLRQCPSNSYNAPPEFILNSFVQESLSRKYNAKFLLGAEQVISTSSSHHGYRSDFGGDIVDGRSYYPASFYIQTRDQYRYVDAGSESYSQLCLNVTEDKDSSGFNPCPKPESDNEAYRFRWATSRHLYHPFSGKCIELNSFTSPLKGVYLRDCNWGSDLQMWDCDKNTLFSIVLKGFFSVVVPTPLSNTFKISITKAEKTAALLVIGGWIPGMNDLPICDDLLRPRHHIFLAQYGLGVFNANESRQIPHDVCRMQKASVASKTELQKVYVRNCQCGWAMNVSKTVSPCTEKACDEGHSNKVWCDGKKTADPSLRYKYSLGIFCLGFVGAPYKHVGEISCETPVHDKACVSRARFMCDRPPTNIANGYRIDGEDQKERDYGYGETVFYVCNDAYHFSDGTISQRSLCKSDGTWSLSVESLLCIQRKCKIPRNPAHGNKFRISADASGMLSSSSLEVTCKRGYTAAPGLKSTVSQCGRDGKWHPDIAQCKPIRCGKPPYVRDTVVSGISFSVWSHIFYRCKYGKTFVDARGRLFNESMHTCNIHGHWFPLTSRLKCVPVHCSRPENVISVYGNGLGETIVIGCPVGFSLHYIFTFIGQKTFLSVCNANKRWNPPVDGLTCIKPLCPEISNMKSTRFGSWKSSSRDISRMSRNGSVAKIECVEGTANQPFFVLFNDAQGRQICVGASVNGHKVSIQSFNGTACSENITGSVLWRWWPEDTKHLQHLATGMCLSVSLPATEVHLRGQTEVFLRPCNDKDSHQMLFCQFENSHHPCSVSFVSKSLQHVGLLTLEEQKVVVGSNKNGGTQTSWSTNEGCGICSLRDEQTEFNLLCSSDGKWVPGSQFVKCRPTFCSIPLDRPELEFKGFRPGENVPYKSEAEAICADGYQSMHSTRTLFRCGDLGVWQPNTNVEICQQISCKPLKALRNAILFPGSKGFSYMSEVTVSCRRGMWFKEAMSYSQMASCGKDGTWSLAIHDLACTPVSCPSNFTTPDHAQVITKPLSHYNYGNVIRITCTDGWTFRSGQQTSTVICDETGNWAPNDLKCYKTFCHSFESHLPYASSHRLLLGRKTYAGQKVPYFCTNRKLLPGSQSINISCGIDGSWHSYDSSLLCRSSTCIPSEKLGAMLPNSTIFGSDSTIGGVINITCHAGFQMFDGSTEKDALCSKWMKWLPSINLLRCQSVLCPELPKPISGTIKIISETIYGSMALLQCQAGYSLSLHGSTSILLKCGSEGQWMPAISVDICQPAICLDPPVTHMQKFRLDKEDHRAVGATATVSCIEDHIFEEKSSLLTSTCMPSSHWHPHPETLLCQTQSCDDRDNSSTFPMEHGKEQKNFMVQEKCKSKYLQDMEKWNCHTVQNKSESLDCKSISCSAVPTIPYSDITTFKPGIYGGLTPNSKVVYRCRDRFYVEGLRTHSAEIVCNSSGMWNPDPSSISCTIVECSTLSPIYTRNSNDLQYNARIRVSCATGFRFLGEEKEMTFTCSSNGTWSHEVSDNDCKRIECGSPPARLNSNWLILTNTAFGGTARYTCFKGFEMKKGKRSWDTTCSRFGDWQPRAPQCVESRLFYCDIPEPMVGAKRLLSADYLKGRQSVYSCDSGKRMEGNRSSLSVSCSESGDWLPDISRLGGCKEIKCKFPVGTDFSQMHLIIEVTPQDYYAIGDSISFSCVSGYWRLNNSLKITIRCQHSGLWSPDPLKIKCMKSECKPLPQIQYSSLSRYINPVNLLSGKYSCDTGYLFFSSSFARSNNFRTSCYYDKWIPDPKLLKCEILTCLIPPTVERSYIVGESIAFNSSVEYHCDSGFRWPHGQAKLVTTCDESGKWSPDPKLYSCSEIYCNYPLRVDGAEVDFKNTKFGSDAVYSCNSGKILQNGETKIVVTCQSDGRWTPSPVNAAQCINITCPAPPAIKYAISQRGDVFSGGIWWYRCIDGFEVEEGTTEFSISCSSSGSWIVDKNCSAIACGKPPVLEHVKLAYNKTILPSGSLVETAQYLCNDGTWISNGANKSFSADIVCINGKWFPNPFHVVKCVPVTCRAPSFMEDRSFNYVKNFAGASSHYMSSIRYACPKGYFFDKSKRSKITAKCSALGRWTKSEPLEKCQLVYCASDINDHHAVWVKEQRHLLGSSIHITCLPSHWYSPGSRSITVSCHEGGRWLPEAKCVPVFCAKPSIIGAVFQLLNGSEGTEGYSISSVLSVSCVKGYKQQGQYGILYCEFSGEWAPHPRNIICNPVSCPLPSRTPDNAEYHGSNKFNSSLHLRCNPGYMISVKLVHVTAKCMASKKWSTDLSQFKCIAIKCLMLEEVIGPNMVVPRPVRYFGYEESLIISCQKHYAFEDGERHKSVFCATNAYWNPLPEALECKRISCKLPRKVANADMNVKSYTWGSRLTVRCYPLHWIAFWIERKWIRIQFLELNLQCKDDGKWEIDPSSIRCLSTGLRMGRQNSNHVAWDKASYSTKGQLKWLRYHAPYAVSGPENILKNQERFFPNDFLQHGISKRVDYGLWKNCTLDIGCSRSSLPSIELMSSIKQWHEYFQQNKEKPIFTSSDILRLWDGDPLSAWKPTPSSISWKFEVHLGNPHLVQEIMIMSASDVFFNVSFSSKDDTFVKQLFGPFHLMQEANYSVYRVSRSNTIYGPVTILSGFPSYAASLVEFVFNSPPEIREISFKAAATDNIWVSSSSPLVITLTTTAAVFLVFFAKMKQFEKPGKQVDVIWLGSTADYNPVLIRYKICGVPRPNLDFYVRLFFYKKKVSSRDHLKFYPDPNDFKLEIISKMEKNSTYNQEKWKLRDIKVSFDGKRWLSNPEDFTIGPNSSVKVGFQSHVKPESLIVILGEIISKYHCLGFICPTKSLLKSGRLHFGIGQRLACVLFTLSISMMTAVICGHQSVIETHTAGYWSDSIVARISQCAFMGTAAGVVCLILARRLFWQRNTSFKRIQDSFLEETKVCNHQSDCSRNTCKCRVSTLRNNVWRGSDQSKVPGNTVPKSSTGWTQLNTNENCRHVSRFPVANGNIILLLFITTSIFFFALCTYMVLTAHDHRRSLSGDAAVAASLIFILSGTMVEFVISISFLGFEVLTSKMEQDSELNDLIQSCRGSSSTLLSLKPMMKEDFKSTSHLPRPFLVSKSKVLSSLTNNIALQYERTSQVLQPIQASLSGYGAQQRDRNLPRIAKTYQAVNAQRGEVRRKTISREYLPHVAKDYQDVNDQRLSSEEQRKTISREWSMKVAILRHLLWYDSFGFDFDFSCKIFKISEEFGKTVSPDLSLEPGLLQTLERKPSTAAVHSPWRLGGFTHIPLGDMQRIGEICRNPTLERKPSTAVHSPWILGGFTHIPLGDMQRIGEIFRNPTTMLKNVFGNNIEDKQKIEEKNSLFHDLAAMLKSVFDNKVKDKQKIEENNSLLHDLTTMLKNILGNKVAKYQARQVSGIASLKHSKPSPLKYRVTSNSSQESGLSQTHDGEFSTAEHSSASTEVSFPMKLDRSTHGHDRNTHKSKGKSSSFHDSALSSEKMFQEKIKDAKHTRPVSDAEFLRHSELKDHRDHMDSSLSSEDAASVGNSLMSYRKTLRDEIEDKHYTRQVSDAASVTDSLMSYGKMFQNEVEDKRYYRQVSDAASVRHSMLEDHIDRTATTMPSENSALSNLSQESGLSCMHHGEPSAVEHSLSHIKACTSMRPSHLAHSFSGKMQFNEENVALSQDSSISYGKTSRDEIGVKLYTRQVSDAASVRHSKLEDHNDRTDSTLSLENYASSNLSQESGLPWMHEEKPSETELSPSPAEALSSVRHSYSAHSFHGKTQFSEENISLCHDSTMPHDKMFGKKVEENHYTRSASDIASLELEDHNDHMDSALSLEYHTKSNSPSGSMSSWTRKGESSAAEQSSSHTEVLSSAKHSSSAQRSFTDMQMGEEDSLLYLDPKMPAKKMLMDKSEEERYASDLASLGHSEFEEFNSHKDLALPLEYSATEAGSEENFSLSRNSAISYGKIEDERYTRSVSDLPSVKHSKLEGHPTFGVADSTTDHSNTPSLDRGFTPSNSMINGSIPTFTSSDSPLKTNRKHDGLSRSFELPDSAESGDKEYNVIDQCSTDQESSDLREVQQIKTKVASRENTSRNQAHQETMKDFPGPVKKFAKNEVQKHSIFFGYGSLGSIAMQKTWFIHLPASFVHEIIGVLKNPSFISRSNHLQSQNVLRNVKERGLPDEVLSPSISHPYIAYKVESLSSVTAAQQKTLPDRAQYVHTAEHMNYCVNVIASKPAALLANIDNPVCLPDVNSTCDAPDNVISTDSYSEQEAGVAEDSSSIGFRSLQSLRHALIDIRNGIVQDSGLHPNKFQHKKS